MPTYCLSLHASYRCRHAGACCAAPWAVRADEDVVRFVESSALRARGGSPFVRQRYREEGEPALSLAKDADGVCVFRAGRRCSLQLAGGEAALPVGCRHYPRVLRMEDARVSLSLSHYCPTAASLLASDAPIEVLSAGPPLVPADPVEGLDARRALPPLLRPGLLMDTDAYTLWEHSVVHTFSRSGTPDAALAIVRAATERLRGWSPRDGELGDAVTSAFCDASPESGECPPWARDALPLVERLNAGPVSLEFRGDLDLRWRALTAADAAAVDRLLGNYLAARAFGNWIAYQGRGLRTIVAWLHACRDVVRTLVCRASDLSSGRVTAAATIEAIRQADYVLLHTIDSQDFARAAAPLES